MRTVTLGKSGLKVSAVGFGGIPIMRVDEDQAIAAIHRALDLGVTFIDTAAGYSDSQVKIGKAIRGRIERYGVRGLADHWGTDAGISIPAGAATIQTDEQFVGITFLNEEIIIRVGDNHSSIGQFRTTRTRWMQNAGTTVRQLRLYGSVQVDLIPVLRSSLSYRQKA